MILWWRCNILPLQILQVWAAGTWPWHQSALHTLSLATLWQTGASTSPLGFRLRRPSCRRWSETTGRPCWPAEPDSLWACSHWVCTDLPADVNKETRKLKREVVRGNVPYVFARSLLLTDTATPCDYAPGTRCQTDLEGAGRAGRPLCYQTQCCPESGGRQTGPSDDADSAQTHVALHEFLPLLGGWRYTQDKRAIWEGTERRSYVR